ncbi:MAG TPA: hypothetical protein VEK07_04455 [Polyangiaceae bacterium]|nr:hypothetical protein [Polyangiaceae bacterium]
MRLLGVALLFATACGGGSGFERPGWPGPGESHDPLSFLESRLRPFPRSDSEGLLAVTDPEDGRIAIYDSALVVLVLIRAGERGRAARVLLGLLALQDEDGGLPFSFVPPASPDARRYQRSGAIAWVGYAAAEYLDADDQGPARPEVLRLATRAASYVLGHRLTRGGDARSGLVLGGEGTLRYTLEAGRIRETLEAGQVAWASVEHNIDAFFFLRALARASGEARYAAAADDIARALRTLAWNADDAQFVQGVGPGGIDGTHALDCASWGSVLLSATGDAVRAEQSLRAGDEGYASTAPLSDVRGHRPYRDGPLFDDPALAEYFGPRLASTRWEALDLVWPEGSAGVALAAVRLGHADRARAILDELEKLRSPDGSLPTATANVPFLLSRDPSVAATAWIDLLRFELQRPSDRPTLWVP